MKKTQSKVLICLIAIVFVVASTIFCCDTFGIRSATISALKYKLNIFHTDKNVDEQIVGDVRVEILDNRNICVIGTYSEFLQNRFEIECKDFLKASIALLQTSKIGLAMFFTT